MIKKLLAVIVLVLICVAVWYWAFRPTMNISDRCISQCEALGQVAKLETTVCYCDEE